MTNNSLGDAIALVISSCEMKVWREVAGTTQDTTRGSQGERRMEDKNEVQTSDEKEEGEIEKCELTCISPRLFFSVPLAHTESEVFSCSSD